LICSDFIALCETYLYFSLLPNKSSKCCLFHQHPSTEEAKRRKWWQPPSPTRNGPCRRSRREDQSSCPLRASQCEEQSCHRQERFGGGIRESVFVSISLFVLSLIHSYLTPPCLLARAKGITYSTLRAVVAVNRFSRITLVGVVLECVTTLCNLQVIFGDDLV
jgi:hypothetical protein